VQVLRLCTGRTAHRGYSYSSTLSWPKVKVKYTLVQALRLCTGRTAYRRSRGIALPFLDHGTRMWWAVSITPRPLFSHDIHCTGGWVGRPARPARPRTQYDYHHDTKVKAEAATAVIELLMMGGKTPETRWALNKCQDNKMKNCYNWLVIYLNCTMMRGHTKL